MAFYDYDIENYISIMPGPQGLKSTKEFNKSKDIPIRDLAAGVMGRTYLGCEDVTEDVIEMLRQLKNCLIVALNLKVI